MVNVLENIHTVINSNNWAKILMARKCNNFLEIVEQVITPLVGKNVGTFLKKLIINTQMNILEDITHLAKEE